MIKTACNHCLQVVDRDKGYIRFEIVEKCNPNRDSQSTEYFEVCGFECANNILRELEVKTKIAEKKNDSQRTNQPAE